MVAACATDVVTHCADVEPGHGRVHECLSKQLKSLSLRYGVVWWWGGSRGGRPALTHTHTHTHTHSCKSEEFLQMVASTEKVALNPMLRAVCKTTLRSKCGDVKDEDGALLRCLEDHAEDEDTPKPCHDAIGRVTKTKNKDFRLNPMLSKVCEDDVKESCAAEFGAATRGGDELGGKVIQCLIDKRAELKKPACKAAVMRKQVQRTANVKNDPGQMNACANDIKNFCGDVEEGEGRIHKCLFANLANISPACKEKEFKTQVMDTPTWPPHDPHTTPT